MADRRVPSNYPRNNYGTFFGSNSFLVSKVSSGRLLAGTYNVKIRAVEQYGAFPRKKKKGASEF